MNFQSTVQTYLAIIVGVRNVVGMYHFWLPSRYRNISSSGLIASRTFVFTWPGTPMIKPVLWCHRSAKWATWMPAKSSKNIMRPFSSNRIRPMICCDCMSATKILCTADVRMNIDTWPFRRKIHSHRLGSEHYWIDYTQMRRLGLQTRNLSPSSLMRIINRWRNGRRYANGVNIGLELLSSSVLYSFYYFMLAQFCFQSIALN